MPFFITIPTDPDKYDVELLMNQTTCTKEVAIKYLKKYDSNLTAAIYAITAPEKFDD